MHCGAKVCVSGVEVGVRCVMSGMVNVQCKRNAMRSTGVGN